MDDGGHKSVIAKLSVWCHLIIRCHVSALFGTLTLVNLVFSCFRVYYLSVFGPVNGFKEASSH